MTNIFYGIDLGGTTVNIGVVTGEGAIIAERKIPSDVERGVDFVVARIGETIFECGKKIGRNYVATAVGIGVAGLVDTKNGILREATNFPGWINVPLAAKLADKLKLPVIMDNDANVAALGEYTFGAGRGCPHMLMVTLGTGVGGGLILDGKIYHGASDAAGEFGHITIDKKGPRCGCGRPGCVEAYVGTRGLLRDVKKLLPSFPASTLKNYNRNTLTPKDIHREAKAGDELARLIFHQAGENLGYGLGNVVNLLNIQRIVIGGGVAAAGHFIIKSAQKTLDGFRLNNSDAPVKIVKAQLGVRAGLVGAASLAMAAI